MRSEDYSRGDDKASKGSYSDFIHSGDGNHSPAHSFRCRANLGRTRIWNARKARPLQPRPTTVTPNRARINAITSLIFCGGQGADRVH